MWKVLCNTLVMTRWIMMNLNIFIILFNTHIYLIRIRKSKRLFYTTNNGKHYFLLWIVVLPYEMLFRHINRPKVINDVINYIYCLSILFVLFFLPPCHSNQKRKMVYGWYLSFKHMLSSDVMPHDVLFSKSEVWAISKLRFDRAPDIAKLWFDKAPDVMSCDLFSKSEVQGAIKFN